MDDLIAHLKTGASSPLDDYARFLVAETLRQGDDVGEAVKEVLLVTNAATPFLLAERFTLAQPIDRAAVVLRFTECINDVVARLCPEFATAKRALLRTDALHEERCKLARDLHDSWAQSIYGMSLLAETAERSLSAGNRDALGSQLAQIRELTRTMLTEMRILIFQLHPPDMAKTGLVGAIRARLDLVEKRAGIETSLAVDGTHRPPLQVEEEILGIASELLNNAIRHARATRVSVVLQQSTELVSLEVADDGVGFDLAKAREGGGLGLADMAERSRAIAAVLSIDTAPGRGTRARVAVAREKEGHALAADSHPGC